VRVDTATRDGVHPSTMIEAKTSWKRKALFTYYSDTRYSRYFWTTGSDVRPSEEHTFYAIGTEKDQQDTASEMSLKITMHVVRKPTS